MLRRSPLARVQSHGGFQRINEYDSPMNRYSSFHWHYERSQVMQPPQRVNRSLTGPYRGRHNNVNKYKGVWIDIDMHPAMRVALAPYLDKLQVSRQVPSTTAEDAVNDYKTVSPLVQDDQARLNWLAKVIQLCAFKGGNMNLVQPLWDAECNERFVVGTERPPAPLVMAYLFACAASSSKAWLPVFKNCLREEWNLTPHFGTDMWNQILLCSGRAGDSASSMLVLHEMLDVQENLELVDRKSYVAAFNVIKADNDYNAFKKFLFSLEPTKITQIHKYYIIKRSESEEDDTFPDNDKIFYHVAWHQAIRTPRGFNPRQLYFDYKPVFHTRDSETSKKNVTDVVKDKIQKWKEEGLLPEDYEFEGNVEDRGAKFRAKMRHEHWAKMPKILKNKKYGYCGEH